MKAFVVVAFLVASVAARTVDVDSLRLLKEKSLLKEDLLKERLFGNQRFQLPKKSLLGGYYPEETTTVGDLDVVSQYGLDYPRTTFGQSTYGQRRVTVLSFEELMSTPLFREYYNIPLFRQFLQQYPVVFQKYIESVLFQQFWTETQFQTYFRNPVLFYKYIVPQVQVIAQQQSEYYPISGDYKTYNKDYDYEYLTSNHRNVYPEGREVVVGDYLNKIFSGLHHQGQFNGYSNEFTSFPYSRYGNNQVNYKFLLDKIYRTLFVNQPTVGEVTQVRTDVKVAPAHIAEKVSPITGETKVVVEEPKIVDVKVDEKIVPRTQVGTELEGEVIVKDVLLKKLLLNKVITPELYQVLRTLPISQIEELIQSRQGIFRDVVDTPYVHRREVESPFVTRRDIYGELETPYTTTHGIFDTPYTTRHHQYYGQGLNTEVYGRHGQYNKLYNNEIVGDRVVPVLRELLNTIREQRIPTEVRV